MHRVYYIGPGTLNIWILIYHNIKDISINIRLKIQIMGRRHLFGPDLNIHSIIVSDPQQWLFLIYSGAFSSGYVSAYCLLFYPQNIFSSRIFNSRWILHCHWVVLFRGLLKSAICLISIPKFHTTDSLFFKFT
mgnify:CR=1 FL=1